MPRCPSNAFLSSRVLFSPPAQLTCTAVSNKRKSADLAPGGQVLPAQPCPPVPLTSERALLEALGLAYIPPARRRLGTGED